MDLRKEVKETLDCFATERCKKRRLKRRNDEEVFKAIFTFFISSNERAKS
jgi:hypothetical protein